MENIFSYKLEFYFETLLCAQEYLKYYDCFESKPLEFPIFNKNNTEYEKEMWVKNISAENLSI